MEAGALDRREFMKASGVLAGAIAASCAGLGAPLERALAAGSRLTPPRRRTYRALVEAVGAAPGNQVDGSAAPRAVSVFSAAYDTHFPEARARIDDVLDAIERLPGHGRFSELSRPERLSLLTSRAREGSQAERQAITDAVALAAAPFRPDPDEGGRAVVVLA